MLSTDLVVITPSTPPAFADVAFPGGAHVHVHVATSLAQDAAVADLLTSVIVRAEDGDTLQRDMAKLGEQLGFAIRTAGRDNAYIVVDRATEPYADFAH